MRVVAGLSPRRSLLRTDGLKLPLGEEVLSAQHEDERDPAGGEEKAYQDHGEAFVLCQCEAATHGVTTRLATED